jgi:hypothetical protein
MYEIEIDSDSWNALQDRWQNWRVYEDQGLETKDWHPLIEFRYKNQVIRNASVRLKGNAQNWHASPAKMQFTFSFREVDPKGRFMGMRKVHLDAPHNDPTMLRERLAAAYLARFGVPTPCVNSAVLYVNGEYYGLFSNIEFVDQEFLQRNYGVHDGGNLYKYIEKKTNESDPDTSDLDAFMSDMTAEEAEELLDIDQFLRLLAGEAIMPQHDGYFVGGTNYYVYNHPVWGMVVIPWDMDYSFEAEPWDVDPISYRVPWGLGKGPAFTAVMGVPANVVRYVELLTEGVAFYEVAWLLARIDDFSEQVANYVEEDWNKPFSTELHRTHVAELRAYVQMRHAYLTQWLRDTGSLTGYRELISGTWSILFGHTRLSWLAAQNDCLSQGGELFVPWDQSEQDEVSAYAKSLSKMDWWIGANNMLVPGLWTDATQFELQYMRWGPGQPNGDGDQRCAVLDLQMGGLWNDRECDGYSLPYICRRLLPDKR